MLMSWVIDQIPLWVYVVVGLVLAGVAYVYLGQFLIPIWRVLPNWAKTVIYFMLAVGAAFVYGRNKAARDFKERQRQLNERAVETRREIHDDVERTPDSELDKRMSKWLRD